MNKSIIFSVRVSLCCLLCLSFLVGCSSEETFSVKLASVQIPSQYDVIQRHFDTGFAGEGAVDISSEYTVNGETVGAGENTTSSIISTLRSKSEYFSQKPIELLGGEVCYIGSRAPFWSAYVCFVDDELFYYVHEKTQGNHQLVRTQWQRAQYQYINFEEDCERSLHCELYKRKNNCQGVGGISTDVLNECLRHVE